MAITLIWPIKTLKKSKYVDKIILNTDSKKIKNLGNKMGAEIPFLRPKHLASDNSKIANTIIHTIQYFKKKNSIFKKTNEIITKIKYDSKKWSYV